MAEADMPRPWPRYEGLSALQWPCFIRYQEKECVIQAA